MQKNEDALITSPNNFDVLGRGRVREVGRGEGADSISSLYIPDKINYKDAYFRIPLGLINPLFIDFNLMSHLHY